MNSRNVFSKTLWNCISKFPFKITANQPIQRFFSTVNTQSIKQTRMLSFDEVMKRKWQIDSVIRVDHAGEFGAQRIYEGQLAVLKDTPSGPIIQEMMNQEVEHLKTFERLVRERRVRPTLLSPIWHVLGYAAGVGSALLGKETAMALTVAVEEVIGEHYNSQLRDLNDLEIHDPELRDAIKKFRDDELGHLDTGLKHDAEKAPFYNIFKEASKAGTRLAIWLSTRI